MTYRPHCFLIERVRIEKLRVPHPHIFASLDVSLDILVMFASTYVNLSDLGRYRGVKQPGQSVRDQVQ